MKGRQMAHDHWNKPQPAPKALWLFIHGNFPKCRNLGIFNRRVVAGTNTLSHHAEGRALDIGLLASVQDEKWLADKLFEIFVKGANPKDRRDHLEQENMERKTTLRSLPPWP
jgi:hypothetical protein